jgi:acylglycerol lipase
MVQESGTGIFMSRTVIGVEYVEHKESTFETRDGLRLFEQSWIPAGESKAAVVIVHGFAEHSSRYKHVANYLTDRNYSVHSFDLRGHGRSEGERAFIRSFDNYLNDLELFLSRLQEREPGRRVFVLGHSMGGSISSLYTITRKPNLRGLILSAPALKISDSISPFLVRLSVLIGHLLPKLRTIKLDSKAISRDPEVVKSYDSDSFVYRGGIPALSGAEMVQATNRIQARMSEISLPLLIMHGTADALTDVEGSRQLNAGACSTDKTLKLYENLYHEILNEPEKAQVLDDMVLWLDSHI